MITAVHIAQFLGKKIAVNNPDKPDVYEMYKLVEIHSNHIVIVEDKAGTRYRYKWERLENPYFILNESKDIEIK